MSDLTSPLWWLSLILFLPALAAGRPWAAQIAVLGSLSKPITITLSLVFFAILQHYFVRLARRWERFNDKIEAVERHRWVAPVLRWPWYFGFPGMVLLALAPLGTFAGLLFLRRAASRSGGPIPEVAWRVGYVAANTASFTLFYSLPIKYVLVAVISFATLYLAIYKDERLRVKKELRNQALCSCSVVATCIRRPSPGRLRLLSALRPQFAVVRYWQSPVVQAESSNAAPSRKSSRHRRRRR
jgi:hypothetical protein